MNRVPRSALLSRVLLVAFLGFAASSCAPTEEEFRDAANSFSRMLANRYRMKSGERPNFLSSWPTEGRPTSGDIYWAVRKANSSYHLVALRMTSAQLGPPRYVVRVFGPGGRIVRSGTVTGGLLPYCLVEAKINSEKFPKAYRNRWILCVGFVPPDAMMLESKIVFAPNDFQPDSRTLRVRIEPIEWETKKTFKWGNTQFRNIKPAAIDLRWAEIYPRVQIKGGPKKYYLGLH